MRGGHLAPLHGIVMRRFRVFRGQYTQPWVLRFSIEQSGILSLEFRIRDGPWPKDTRGLSMPRYWAPIVPVGRTMTG